MVNSGSEEITGTWPRGGWKHSTDIHQGHFLEHNEFDYLNITLCLNSTIFLKQMADKVEVVGRTSAKMSTVLEIINGRIMTNVYFLLYTFLNF